MPLSYDRWIRVSGSAHTHEREALEYLREGLPDSDTYRAWTNFSFLADDGTTNEVDALIITPQGIFLVEIKSHPGSLHGDRGLWTFEFPDGRSRSIDNPIYLADLKAKRLKSLLMKQKTFQPGQTPYIDSLIFLSHPTLSVRIDPSDRIRMCQRDVGNTPGILAALKSREAVGLERSDKYRTNRPLVSAFIAAMKGAGIRKSQSSQQVGQFRLEELLSEGRDGVWQDFAAVHSTVKKDLRRVRIYSYDRQSDTDPRIIRAAAQREYEILRSLSHPNIVPANDYVEHEFGPALVFPRDAGETRLDFFMKQHGTTLSLTARLELVRQIADALRYAHGRRIVHRALSPESILVGGDPASPKVRIFNWQAGREMVTTTLGRTSQTIYPRDYLDPTSAVYLAPESHYDPTTRDEATDIFSLGALAFYIFTNERPAPTLADLDRIVQQHQGLPLTAVLDAPSERLSSLIRHSTCPEVTNRTASAAEFLTELERVEDEWTTPETEQTVLKPPADLRKGDRLPHGLTVLQRLGSGGTAIAFLVEQTVPGEPTTKRELVLKLALRPEFSDRIEAELEALRQLSHAYIVKPHGDLLKLGEYAGFLMDRAGEITLTGKLREEGRLSLDLLSRFGDDLLNILRHLEEAGIPHRDLKPDNMGVHKYRDSKEHLKLFDFSLSRLPLEQTTAGTPPYHEPFLRTRKRWDPAADRFSAAVVLYEMATGAIPRWGDGVSAPHTLPGSVEVIIESSLFDAPVREGLTRFFERALRRDPAQRFDSALDMGIAWHTAFSEAQATESRAGNELDRERALAHATLETSVVLLGLSTRAENVLARENINTVGALLAVPPARFRYLKGVGNTTRKELVQVIRDLRIKFPDVPVSGPLVTRPGTTLTVEPTDTASTATGSIDEIASQLHNRSARATTEREVTTAFLTPNWPTQTDLIGQRRSRQQISGILVKARERWTRTPALTAVRRQVADLLEEREGFLEAGELANILLAMRGSSAEGPERLAPAHAVLRAAVETEEALDAPRFTSRRCGDGVLILLERAEPVVRWAGDVALAAAELANADPIPAPARVLQRLREVPAPDVLVPLPDARLVALAATLAGVAVSPRLELYRRGLPALEALKLSSAALAGASSLTPEEVAARVADRYPESERLPARPDLDAMLEAAGLDHRWSPVTGAYEVPAPPSTSGTPSIIWPATRWQMPSWDDVKPEERPDRERAASIERTLRAALLPGSWLVLGVLPDFAEGAAESLAKRFGLALFDVEQALLKAMREIAQSRGAAWDRVLDADREGHPERHLLEGLAGLAMQQVEAQLRARSGPTLLNHPGLLGRYRLFGVLDRLREAGGPPLWLLAPGQETAHPEVDGAPVPAVGPNQKVWLTRYFLEPKRPGASGSLEAVGGVVLQ